MVKFNKDNVEKQYIARRFYYVIQETFLNGHQLYWIGTKYQ